MLSPADKETKSEKGTSQTWRKKKDAISVKEGREGGEVALVYLFV